jgi:hypothetical protein
MNTSPQVPPTGPERGAADSPLDSLDDAILNEVRAMHDLLDPPPTDLNARVQFAIRLNDFDIEISRLLEDTLTTAGSRAADGMRAITFEAPDLTIMITVMKLDTGGVRLEGWLAPAEPLRVMLRVAGAPDDSEGLSFEVQAEDNGRFVFADVPPGLAQFVVYRTPADGQAAPALVTSPLVL